MSIRFSLREHDHNPNNEPETTFSKEGASSLRMASPTVPSGSGYAFFVCDRSWLNNKYLRWSWSGYYSRDQNGAVWFVYVYDGEYDRTSDVDFPDDTGILTKGNGLLQTVAAKEDFGSWGPETQDVQIDTSGGSETKCTVMFRLRDAWNGHDVNLDLHWVEINTGAGGSGNLYSEDFTDAPTMEQTGTDGDYGYVSSGEISVGFPFSFGTVIA